jgi:hypothetical protein
VSIDELEHCCYALAHEGLQRVGTEMIFQRLTIKQALFLLRHLRDPIVSDAIQLGGVDQYFAQVGLSPRLMPCAASPCSGLSARMRCARLLGWSI